MGPYIKGNTTIFYDWLNIH